MRRHLTVRALAYGVVAGAVVAIVLLGLAIYRQGVTVPPQVLNWRAAQRIAARYGVSYSLDALRIGCLTKTCPGELHAGPLDVEIRTPEAFHLRLSSVRGQRSGALNGTNLEVRSGNRTPLLTARSFDANLSSNQFAARSLRIGLSSGAPPLELDQVEFDGAAKRLAVNRVTARREDRSPVSVDRIELEGWTIPGPNGEIVLNRINVVGVRLPLSGDTPRGNFCKEFPSSTAIDDAAAPLRPLLPLFRESFSRLQADLLRMALVLSAVLAILKFLSVFWLKGWVTRLLLATTPILLIFALYFGLHERWTVIRLVWTTVAAVALMTALYRLFVYRRGEKWHQRWEPVAADLATIVILFPLLGYGYQLLLAPPTPPRGLQLDRLDIANVSAQSGNGVRFEIPQAVVLATQITFPDSAQRVVELSVSAIELPSAAIQTSESSRVTLDPTRVDDVKAAYDPEQREIRNLEAHVRVAGLFESDGLQRELHNIEFLRGAAIRTSHVGFDVDLTAASSGTSTPSQQQFRESRHPIALAANAAAVLNPIDCTARYDVLARVVTPMANLTTRADGDMQRVNVRDLRSLPGSPLQIASGSGNIILGAITDLSFNLTALGGTAGQARMSLASLGISASLPRLGQRGPQTVDLALGPVAIQSAEGLQVRLEQTNMRMDRAANASSVPVRFHTRLKNVRLDRRNNGIVEADFPLLETTIEGIASPELIPRTFAGSASFMMSGADATGELVGSDMPVSFDLDLWKGRLEIPEQPVTLRGVLLSEPIAKIPLRVGLSGQLSSIAPELAASLQGHAAIGVMQQAMGAGRVAVEGIRIDGGAEWNNQGVAGKVNYATGWIDAELPAPPPIALCLDEISTLELTVVGKASRIPSLGNSRTAPATAPSTCASLPALHPVARFRLSGAYPPGPQAPVVRLENENGKGVRIGDVDSEIQTLRIRSGRLVETGTRVSVTGIQNLEGRGGFDIHANLHRAGDSLDAESSILASDGTRLLEATVASRPDSIVLDASQHAPSDQILDRLRPFLPDLNLDAGGFTPHVRITRLHAEANLDRGALQDAVVSAELAGGALISVNRPDLKMNFSTPSAGPGPSLRLSIGGPRQPDSSRSIEALLDVAGGSIDSSMNDAVTLGMETKIRLAARGVLLLSDRPPESPVLKRVFEVGSGLGREVSRLASILGSESPSAPATNIEWNLNLPPQDPGQPLVRFTSGTILVNAPRASFNAKWEGNTAQTHSSVAGSASVDTTIALVDDQLLLEALPSVQLAVALSGEPETQFASNLPIQVAFSERLKEARLQRDSLWDADQYASFWNAHPSRFSETDFTAPLDLGEAQLGPLSVRQVLFPVKPLRAVVGYSNGLQLGLPFSGRALFGVVGGTLETNLTSSADAASLDMRLNVDLKNIQAGGLRVAMGSAHSAIVEDELDGTALLRLDRLKLDRSTLAAMLAGKSGADELEKIGLSVHLFRSPEAANLPAVLQASSEVQVNLANELLNTIASNLRLSGPPRALTYRDFDLKLEVDRGRVLNDREILRLGGLQILTADLVDVTGEVRTHLGRPGDRVLLTDIIEMLTGLMPATEAEGR